MLDIYFKFDGKDSRNMGICAQSFFEVSQAMPNIERFSIPGRNGALTFWDGSYANRSIIMPSFLLSEILQKDITAINAWLLTDQSYRKLILSDDPEHFFLARALGGISENIRAGLLTPFDLEFDAKPQRFLLSGAREMTAGGNIYNPTKFTAHPILKLTTTSTAVLTVGEAKATFTGLSGTITLDTETGKATMNGINVNTKVSFDEDLALLPGNNAVTLTGGGTLKFIPRWWEL